MTKRLSKKELAPELAVPLVPQPNGGALLAGGVPGHRGGSGRPPDAFKALCRDLASGERTITEVQAILDDHDHPHFIAALKLVSEYGYGRPKGTVEEPRHSGVIVLGPLSGMTMDDARQMAHEHRMEHQGMVGARLAIGDGYVPPPGHTVNVIEEDLSVPASDGSRTAATNGTKTKAQEIAERRRKLLES